MLDDLREWDYGVYEGRTTAEIRDEIPGWSVWSDPIVDGESLDDVAARARRVLDRVAGVEGRVVLFAHAHILRILTACALGLDPAAGKVLGLDAGSISVLGHEHDYRVDPPLELDRRLTAASYCPPTGARPGNGEKRGQAGTGGSACCSSIMSAITASMNAAASADGPPATPP